MMHGFNGKRNSRSIKILIYFVSSVFLVIEGLSSGSKFSPLPSMSRERTSHSQSRPSSGFTLGDRVSRH